MAASLSRKEIFAKGCVVGYTPFGADLTESLLAYAIENGLRRTGKTLEDMISEQPSAALLSLEGLQKNTPPSQTPKP